MNILYIVFGDKLDYHRIAAGAEHDARRHEKSQNGVVQIGRTYRELTDITLDEDAVYHLIDRDKNEREDARKHELKNGKEIKVLCQFVIRLAYMLFCHLYFLREKIPLTASKRVLLSCTLSLRSLTVISS